MANTRYENFILENKLSEILTTAIDVNSYMTLDTTLVGDAGMVKKINVYTATGDVEDVAEGAGNSTSITMSYTAVPYTVGTTQGRFAYTDEDEMTDPFLVDGGLTDLGKKLTNNLTAKAVAEFNKATLTGTYAKNGAPTFDTIVDGIALLNKESDEDAGLFILVNPAMKATLRKSLADDLKYSEGFTRTGYIGSVCGVPVIVSKAVANGTIIIATKKAVTCFVKKNSEIEQERNANTRTNTIYGRFVNVVALTDASEVCVIKEALA